MNSTKAVNTNSKFGQFLSVPLLIVIFFLLVACSTVALRANNTHMMKLRQSVLVADQTGNDVDGALYALRSYVVNHMNTNLNTNGSNEPPLQLVNTYYRAILQREASDAVINKSITTYNDAIKKCSGEVELFKKVSCVENFLTTHSNGLTNPNLPNKSLYEFNFISPSWTPDVAGLLIAASIFTGFVLFFRVLYLVFHRNPSK